MLSSVRMSRFGQSVFGLLFGAGSAFFGYLIARPSFLPKLLDVLQSISGLGFVASTVLSVLVPSFKTSLLIAPTALARLFLTLWLLVKGVNVSKWQESASLAGSRST